MSDSKVLTENAWGYVTKSGGINGETACVEGQHGNNSPVVIVHIPGLTHDQMESDILAGLDLLAKSREVNTEQTAAIINDLQRTRAFLLEQILHAETRIRDGLANRVGVGNWMGLARRLQRIHEGEFTWRTLVDKNQTVATND